jgi:hypothetical protein
MIASAISDVEVLILSDLADAQNEAASPASDSSKVRTLRLVVDLVAQEYHAVFERGGLDQL